MGAFRREIALAVTGLAATVAGFAAGGPVWGWRVLGGFLLSMAAWVFLVRHAGYLVPGFEPGRLGGKVAGAVTFANAALGLLLLWHASDLAPWTHAVCDRLPLLSCEAAPDCVNSHVRSLTSPARNVRALVFSRACGARETTEVSIVAAGEPLPDRPGNVFAVEGKADLTLMWIAARHLAIAGIGRMAPKRQETFVGGVRISYDERGR